MKKIINIFIYFIAIMLLNIMQGYAQSDEFNLEQTKRILTGQIEEALKSSGGASISISLIKEDKIVWSAAFGYSNIRAKSFSTLETFYNTASTFKPVTATAIMQLVEKKKINLDDPIHKYLDERIIKNWGKREKKVTFRHILSHRSGFAPDVIGQYNMNVWRRDTKKLKSLEVIASELKSIRDPGETYEYNNLAFAVLGLLVEKVSGISYEEYIVNNILKPVGVYTTNLVSPTPKMVEMMAFPYIREENGSLKPAEMFQYSIYPAGDIYLTAGPLAGLHAGLLTAKHSHSLVVACDMPFLNLKLLNYMVSLPLDYDVLIPKIGGWLEPLHAIYSRRCIEPIERRLHRHRNCSVFYRKEGHN